MDTCYPEIVINDELGLRSCIGTNMIFLADVEGPIWARLGLTLMNGFTSESGFVDAGRN